MAEFAQPNRNRQIMGSQGIPMDPGTRGFVLRDEDLARINGQIPQVPPRGFVISAQSAAAIGQGVQDVGGEMGKIAMEQLRSVNEYQIAEAGVAMETAGSEIMAEIAQEPDETKWKDIAGKRINKLDLTKNLSPNARWQVEVDQMRWSNGLLGRVTVESAKASFEREVGAKKAVALRFADQGNADSAVEVMRGLHSRGRISDLEFAQSELSLRKQAEDSIKRTEAAREKAALDLDEAEAINDPFEWRTKNATPWKGREQAWARVKNIADSRAREVTADFSESTLDAIYSEGITLDEQIDALDVPGVTPRLKSQLKGFLAGYNKEKVDAYKREHGDEAFIKEWVAARQVDFKKIGSDADQAHALNEMFNRIRATVPNDRAGEITQLLHQKFGTNAPNLKPAPEVQKYIDARLKSVHDSWGFGRLMRYEPNDPGANARGNVVDPALEALALRKWGEATLEMRKWGEQNPSASFKDADAKLSQVLDGSVTDESARSMGVPVNERGEAGPGEWQQYLQQYNGPTIQFGGQKIEGGEFIAKPSVFGGPNDPVDNGLSAFGGKTGAGGKEGVAIPEKILRQFYGNDRKLWEQAKVEVTTESGSTHILDIADLGTAEWVWDRAGMPVQDLTEGAVEQLGGTVVYDRRGKQKDVKGLGKLKVRLLKPGELGWSEDIQQPPFSE